MGEGQGWGCDDAGAAQTRKTTQLAEFAAWMSGIMNKFRPLPLSYPSGTLSLSPSISGAKTITSLAPWARRLSQIEAIASAMPSPTVIEPATV